MWLKISEPKVTKETIRTKKKIPSKKKRSQISDCKRHKTSINNVKIDSVFPKDIQNDNSAHQYQIQTLSKKSSIHIKVKVYVC